MDPLTLHPTPLSTPPPDPTLCRTHAAWTSTLPNPHAAQILKWTCLSLMGLCTLLIGSYAWIRARSSFLQLRKWWASVLDLAVVLGVLVVQVLLAATGVMGGLWRFYCVGWEGREEGWKAEMQWDVGWMAVAVVVCVGAAGLDVGFLAARLVADLRSGDGRGMGKLDTPFSFLFVVTVFGVALGPLWMPVAVPWAWGKIGRRLQESREREDVEMGSFRGRRRGGRESVFSSEVGSEKEDEGSDVRDWQKGDEESHGVENDAVSIQSGKPFSFEDQERASNSGNATRRGFDEDRAGSDADGCQFDEGDDEDVDNAQSEDDDQDYEAVAESQHDHSDGGWEPAGDEPETEEGDDEAYGDDEEPGDDDERPEDGEQSEANDTDEGVEQSEDRLPRHPEPSSYSPLDDDAY